MSHEAGGTVLLASDLEDVENADRCDTFLGLEAWQTS